MHRLIAIDPSVLNVGIAVFDDGVLTCSKHVSIPYIVGEDQVARWRRAAVQVAHEIPIAPLVPLTTHELVFERPRIYQRGGGRTKGDPNNLLGMVGLIGGIAMFYTGLQVESYEPAEWKGQIKKKVMCNLILKLLTKEERELVPDSEDAIDAAGVGLRKLGRLAAPSARGARRRPPPARRRRR